VPGVYHPQATLEMVARATSRPLIHAKGKYLAELIGCVPPEIRGMMRGGVA